jgi:hypothetical protein
MSQTQITVGSLICVFFAHNTNMTQYSHLYVYAEMGNQIAILSFQKLCHGRSGVARVIVPSRVEVEHKLRLEVEETRLSITQSTAMNNLVQVC